MSYSAPDRVAQAPRGKPPFKWIAAAILLLLGLGIAAYTFSGGKSAPKKKATMVNIVPVLPPPPPPPKPQPTPPPPENPAEPPPDAPEFVEEKAPDAAPEPEPDAPEPMGSNIQGDGAPDGFGLVGKGGGGMIGGRGTGAGGTGSRFGWYAGRVQNSVSAAVRNHKLTRSARMTVKARIWVDGSGRITRASLEGSSGSPEIDRALQNEILTGVRLPEAPPADMPMPIVMRISAARP
jgi:TonB family protein